MDSLKLVRIYGNLGNQLLVDLTKVVYIGLDKRRMYFHYNNNFHASHMFPSEDDAANELQDIQKHLESYFNKSK